MESCRWVELVVRVAETELGDQLLGCIVRRVVAGKEPARVQDVEGVVDHGLGSLKSKSLSPEVRADVDPKFVNALARLIRSQSAASNVRTVREQEDRPVLEPMLGLKRELSSKALLDCFEGRCPTRIDETCDSRIAPQALREADVFASPGTEAQSLGGEKIIGAVLRRKTHPEPERGHQISPPEPVHSQESGDIEAMPHGVVASNGAPAAMNNGDDCFVARALERHLDFRLLTWGEVHPSPFEDESRRRLPRRNISGHEHPGPSVGLERLEQPAPDARLQMDDPPILPGDPEAQATPPPKVDFLGEDLERNRRLHRNRDRHLDLIARTADLISLVPGVQRVP